MDKTAQATLSVAHQNLSDDLAKVGQLIEPVNDRALAMLSRVQRRLLDIQELVKVLAKDQPETTAKGFVGAVPEDTLSNVSDVLLVLSNVDYEDCAHSNEFTCGMMKILRYAMDALDHEVGRVGTLRKGTDA